MSVLKVLAGRKGEKRGAGGRTALNPTYGTKRRKLTGGWGASSPKSIGVGAGNTTKVDRKRKKIANKATPVECS